MFITLQFPFLDLRRFLRYPPVAVPSRPEMTNPAITDLERIADNQYVRCFGHYRTRSYTPNFKPGVRYFSQEEQDWQNLNLTDTWQDEYLYASTRRGLRFDRLEKQQLLDGKLANPSAKIRALRFSSLDPTNAFWSPCIRIETGILYTVKEPLKENELISALLEFLKLQVVVPVYERDGAGRNAKVTRKLQKGTLIEQQKALARLMVNSTTAQYVLRLHHTMIIPGEPLLSVHYTKNEIEDFPSNMVSIPKTLAQNTKIHYCPLQKPRIGLWMFEVPEFYLKKKTLAKKKEAIRNNTIAVMRYWSELQAILTLRSEIVSNSLEIQLKGNKHIQDYINRATKFLLRDNWHGAHLDVIRDIINAHQIAAGEKQAVFEETIKDLKRQVAAKLKSIGTRASNVFVSYSHIDKIYLPLIQAAFATLYKTTQFSYFDDTYLTAGDEWEQKIRQGLETATVAVLLVSKNFMSSEYIQSIEQPKFVERFQKGKLNIISVLIDGELPETGFLQRLQFINKDCPLAGCNDEAQREIMKALAEKVVYFQNDIAQAV